jgi:hypothetical protein
MPFEAWPEADRKAWRAACEPTARLKRGGAAGHLRRASREVHERHYGNFLGFLDRNGLLRRDAPAAANVTLENVDTYLAEAKSLPEFYNGPCRDVLPAARRPIHDPGPRIGLA